MAFLSETFSLDTLPQSAGGDFSPLPDGWYFATISSAELKTTNAGTGQYIKLRYDITGPTHQGRVVFGNLNIRNPNPKAEEIGRQDLGSIMRAIGLASVQDSDQLIGGKLQIKLTTRQQEGYEPTNEVKGYKAMTGSTATAPAFGGAQSSGQPSPQAASATPPWAKK